MIVPIKLCRVNKTATLPTYAKPGDSGMDLSTPIDIVLDPGVPVFVDTGIAVAIPEGYEGLVRPRSGRSKLGLIVCSGTGTIDSSYRGPIGIVLLWAVRPPSSVLDDLANGGPMRIAAGERIAQLVIAPVARATIEEVETIEELGATERGVGGFGSTGR